MAAAVTTLRTIGSGLTAANFIGAGGSGAGGWGTSPDIGCISGEVYETETAGDYLADTVPASTHAVALVLRPVNANAQAAKGNLTALSVAIDGVDQRGGFAVPIDSYQFGQAAPRYFLPISRYGAVDWSSGNRVLKVTAVGNNRSLQVDGILYIAQKAIGVPGLTGVGDSLVQHGGADDLTYNKFLDKLYTLLLPHFGNNTASFILSNLGQDGDMLFGQSGNASRTGGMFRFFNNFLANPTSMLVFQYGPNDLSTFMVGGMMHAYHNLLQLVEDTVDLTTVRVAVGTPAWRTPFANCPSVPLVRRPDLASSSSNETGRYYQKPASGFEDTVDAIRGLLEFFTWLRVADNYDATDGRSDNDFPNASSPFDMGNHPGPAGSYKMAERFYRALMNALTIARHTGLR